MNRKTWQKKIKEACKAAGTYKPYFDGPIAELAGILERRDQLEDEYAKDPRPLVNYTYKEGVENMIKNPIMGMIEDAQKQTLAYWKELGLTPAGLRRINEMALKDAEQTKSNSLLEKLAELKRNNAT